jgi:hypothetical protein
MIMRPGPVLRIVALCMLAGNAAVVAAHALFLLSGVTDLMDWSIAILAVPIVVGLVGAARRRRWGRTVSALALAAQMGLFSVHLHRMWGHLHGGEWFLLAWIAYAAVALLIALATPADA